MKSYPFTVKEDADPAESILQFIRREIPKLSPGLWECRLQKPKRNNDQNALFWGWIKLLSHETGNDQQTLYQYYCERFNPSKCTYRHGGAFASGGTSELNTKDFATFLTEIKADVAAEFGINLPTREEEAFKEFYEQYC